MKPSEQGTSSWRVLWPAALLLILASVVIHTVLVVFTAPALLSGNLIDTDSYMRLVRVRELALDGNWFDSVIDRNNWPYGDELHWTRPFDLLILAGAWALTPFLGFTKALFWAGALVSPLLQVVTSIALAWAVIPIIGKRLLPLVMIGVLAQPGFMGYALAGRPDHHIFLLLFAVLLLGAFTRVASLTTQPDTAAHWARWVGVIGAVGIWSSTELLLPLGITLAVSGVAWIVSGEPWLRINRAITVGLAFGVTAGLVIERPLAQMIRAEYDRISIVHLTLAMVLWASWRGVEWASHRRSTESTWFRRGALAAGAGLLTASIMTVLFPQFFRGPMAEMDPRLFAIWYDRITEMEPMWPADLWEVGRVVAYLGAGLVSIAASLRWVLTKEPVRWAWAAWALTATAYVTLALVYNIRFAGGGELLAVPLLIVWLGPLYRRIETFASPLGQIPLRASATATALVGPIFLGGFIMGLGKDAEPDLAAFDGCDVQALSEWMGSPEGPGAEPRTVLAMLDFGPELLYRTQHRVLAGPYHRNASGILDIHDVFTTTDPTQREQILAEREVGWILICPARDEGVFRTPGSLYSTLLESPDPGIEAVPLPEKLAKEFKLFSVEPKRLTQSDTSLLQASELRPGADTSR